MTRQICRPLKAVAKKLGAVLAGVAAVAAFTTAASPAAAQGVLSH